MKLNDDGSHEINDNFLNSISSTMSRPNGLIVGLGQVCKKLEAGEYLLDNLDKNNCYADRKLPSSKLLSCSEPCTNLQLPSFDGETNTFSCTALSQNHYFPHPRQESWKMDIHQENLIAPMGKKKSTPKGMVVKNVLTTTILLLIAEMKPAKGVVPIKFTIREV